MKRPNRHNRHHRTGLGYMETVAILAGLALVIFVGVSQLGSLVSDDIGQTASGIGDPAQLAQHTRFTGEPYVDPDDGSSSGGNNGNGNNGNGNNGNNSGGNGNGNNGNGNNGNGNNGNGNGGGNGGGRNNGGGVWSRIVNLFGW